MLAIKDDDTKDPMRQKTLKKKDPKDKRSKKRTSRNRYLKG